MEIWLNTSDVSVIQQAAQLGVLHGVMTNLSVVSQSKMALEDFLQAALDAQKGPVVAQVVSPFADEMIRQGEALANFSNRIMIKVPVTYDGFLAMNALSSKKIPVMATAVFEYHQAFLASRAGASYVVPYFSEIIEADQNGIDALKEMVQIKNRYQTPAKILVSSLTNMEDVRECFLLGIDAVAMNEKLFHEYLKDSPLTTKVLQRMARDWKRAAPRKSFSF